MLESLFIKNAGLKDCNSIKKLLQHRCFPVNFEKKLKISFFKEYLPWLRQNTEPDQNFIGSYIKKCVNTVTLNSSRLIYFDRLTREARVIKLI